jgi:hypothetical protein
MVSILSEWTGGAVAGIPARGLSYTTFGPFGPHRASGSNCGEFYVFLQILTELSIIHGVV